MLKTIPPPPKPRSVPVSTTPVPRTPIPRQIPVKPSGEAMQETLNRDLKTVDKLVPKPLAGRLGAGNTNKKLSPMEAAENDVQVVKKTVDGLKMPAIKDRDIPVATAAYVALKDMQNKAADDIAELREPLEKFLKENKKVMSSGTEYVDVEHAGRKFRIARELRETAEPKPDAVMKVKRSKKLKALMNKLVYTAEVLDMDELTKLVEKGKVTEQEAKELVNIKKNYAFKVKLLGKK
jgi:hypothetical protein